jgi:hypothetical protein
VDGVLYRVTIGHVTIGWRIFPDWRVTFEEIGGRTKASLAVGMRAGELVSATVR